MHELLDDSMIHIPIDTHHIYLLLDVGGKELVEIAKAVSDMSA